MNDLAHLFAAIEADDLQTVEKLLQKAPQLALATDGDRRTALMLAARFDRRQAAHRLIEAGSELEAVDRVHDSTALACAAYYGSSAVAELLIEAGAQLDPVNRYDMTPEQIAAGGARGEHIADAPTRGPEVFLSIRAQLRSQLRAQRTRNLESDAREA